ncbi:glycosyltransferase family 2 protein [uncultured Cloacibacillus sp.]|uniref:glycosyltransferase family 2 protein n=1 Tax=uncultured Cloacibacillus sp. TaxID=889794 RepID=UPI002633F735|nr:glycosyltransferase family 2 protein [uncultured Cloacibacillus sp.]
MTPLVSIIMPAYNCEKYITEAIASVVNQTYPSWELIVIDDGSQDNTVNIVKGLVLKDKRINLYQNERNMGVSKTRNKGISVAKGQWIAFLDSDDCWAPEKLQRQLCISEEHKEAEFIFSASRFMDENGGLFKWIMPVPEVVTYRDLLKHNVISCSSVLISRQCLGNHRMISDAIHEDFALWLEILKNGSIAYGINEPLLIYRVSSNSKSGNKIKSAKMSYKTYRFLKINFFITLYYMFFYALYGFKKYNNIYKLGHSKKRLNSFTKNYLIF